MVVIKQIGWRGEKIGFRQRANGLRSLYTFYQQALYVKYWAKGDNTIQYDLDIWISNLVQGHCTPLTRRHYAHTISHIGSKEKIYPDKDFTHSMRSDMALTLDLETWFKVTEVLYSKAHWTNWSLSGACRAGL